MIIIMVITMVFVLKMTKFWKLERKKLSLFRRTFPTKTLHTLSRANRASPRKKKIRPSLMGQECLKTGCLQMENLVIFMKIS